MHILEVQKFIEIIEKGIKKGKLEVIKQRNHTIAKDMKSKNMDINLISEITGLPIEEIKKLQYQYFSKFNYFQQP